MTPPLNFDDQDAVAAALGAILDALRRQARTDAALRAHLATLGQALCAIAAPAACDDDPAALPAGAAGSAAATGAPPADLSDPPPALAAPPRSPRASLEDIEQLRRVLRGETDAAPEESPALIPLAPAEPPDDAALLDAISSCCAAKADRIRQYRAQPGAAQPAADAPCDYWMDALLAKPAIAAEDWDVLAGAFEAVAMGVEALANVLADPALARYRLSGLELVAEAQSALRAAGARIWPRPDPSREALFQWLRRRTQADEIYIRRYMRSDDVAAPAEWPARLERIVQWREKIDGLIGRRRHEQKLFSKLRYQIRRVGDGAASEWPRALQTVEALIEHGTPPSSLTLRAVLWPQRAALLAERSSAQGIALVARELERAAAPPSAELRADAGAERVEPHIGQAADLLRNTTLVLIGGDYRPQAAQTIAEAFELRELVWCDTRPHKSHLPLEPAIARADVSVVVLAIRWASHGLGEVRTFCDRYQKPFVRLPGGYNVAQLAYQILQQASGRLAAQRAAADPAAAL